MVSRTYFGSQLFAKVTLVHIVITVIDCWSKNLRIIKFFCG